MLPKSEVQALEFADQRPVWYILSSEKMLVDKEACLMGNTLHWRPTRRGMVQTLLGMTLIASIILLLKQEGRTTTQGNVGASTLQTYYDNMSDLMNNGHLRTAEPQSETRNTARASTLSVLHQLDAEGKAQVIHFLYEANVISGAQPVVPLQLAELQNANLHSANLQNANLQNANLQNANLQNANLQNANLRFANLQSANFQSADLRSADLRFADLHFADLRGAQLLSAKLQGAKLPGANLQGVQLPSAQLPSANLQSANLQAANLQSANLHGANLQSANLQSANLQSANLQVATYDSNTRWPDGFDPQAAGAKQKDTP